MISSSTLSPLDYQLQLPNRQNISAIYARTLLMYTVASPYPTRRGGGQLPNPKSAIYANEYSEGQTLTLNPNKCNSTLTSGTSGGAAPRGGGQLPNPKSAILC